MANLKEELERYGGVTSPVYVYLYEDGSAELDGSFEIEDLQVIVEAMQAKINNKKED